VLSGGRRYEVLAGSCEELECAAARGAVAQRAVFVLQHSGELYLDQERRDLLWHLFGVPSYVMQVDAQYRVRAFECEARAGLHMGIPRKGPVRCGCGRPGDVMGSQPAEEYALAALAG
jgi:hypothetical protein